MLRETLNQFAQDQDKSRLVASVASFFNIKKIAAEVIPWLCGEVELKGFFQIQPFSKCSENHATYRDLFDEFEEELFPAITMGGDGLGVEFWLMLETGQVITLHHDATFFEVAADVSAASPPAFAKEFAKRGSLFSFSQLLELQAFTRSFKGESSEFGRELYQAAAKSLGLSIGQMMKLHDDDRLEFVLAHCGDFIEENGPANLLDAEKKLQKLAQAVAKGKAVKKLDLSYCFLEQVPPELARLGEMEELDLSGNPLESGVSFANVSTRKLLLAACGIQRMPLLPAMVEVLDLSNNPLRRLDGLEVYGGLREVTLAQMELERASVQDIRRALPQCKLDFATAIERHDKVLNLWYSTAKKLPADIRSYTRLEKADLTGNENLDLRDAFQKLAGSAATLRHVLTDAKVATLPAEIVQFQQLELIELKGHQIFEPTEVEKAYALLAQLPRLKAVPFLTRYAIQSHDTQYPEIFLRHLPHFPQLEQLMIPSTFFLNPDLLTALLAVIEPFQALNRLVIHFALPESGDPTTGKFAFLKDRIKQLVLTPARRNHPPAGIFELSGLESLEIRENGFGEERYFGAFPHLKKLVLNVSSERGFVWKGLDKLELLEELEISDLPREMDVPKEIAKMKGLKRLTIRSENGLEKVPDIFGELSALERMELKGKFRFDSIPPSFAKLTALKELEIDANHRFNYADRERMKRFDNVPAALTALTKLETLALRTGVVHQLPTNFTDLENLKALRWWMTYGDDGDFPEGYSLMAPDNPGNLKNLREFSLMVGARKLDVDIAGWYPFFAQLPVLESLRFMAKSANPVPALPAAFGQHPTLKSVDFYLNHNVYTKGNPHGMREESFLPVLAELQVLEHLEVGRAYSLEAAPRTLAQFKQLHSLKLDIDGLSIPEVSKTFEILAQLPQLRRLSLSLGELPREIGLLTQLEFLELPTLPDFPDELMQLQDLKVLHCDFECKTARKNQLEKGLPNCVINRGVW